MNREVWKTNRAGRPESHGRYVSKSTLSCLAIDDITTVSME